MHFIKKKKFNIKRGQALYSVPQGKVNKEAFYEDISAIIHNAQCEQRITDAAMGLKMKMYHTQFKSIKNHPGKLSLRKFLFICGQLGLEVEVRGSEFVEGK